MNSPDPIPPYFGWKYIVWLAWSNAITILGCVQAVFQAITLDPTLLSHNAVHWLSIANLVLIVVIAQIKKNNPPSPPPTRSNP